MVEEYRIQMRTGRAEPTGQYTITNRGTRKPITRYVHRYHTPMGEFEPEEWKKRALAEIEAENKKELLESIKDYCREHCAWLHKEKDVEEYAIECLCSRAYRQWKDFENGETIIWM